MATALVVRLVVFVVAVASPIEFEVGKNQAKEKNCKYHGRNSGDSGCGWTSRWNLDDASGGGERNVLNVLNPCSRQYQTQTIQIERKQTRNWLKEFINSR